MPYIHWESRLSQEKLSGAINLVPKSNRDEDFDHYERIMRQTEGVRIMWRERVVWEKRVFRLIRDFIMESSLFKTVANISSFIKSLFSRLPNRFRKNWGLNYVRRVMKRDFEMIVDDLSTYGIRGPLGPEPPVFPLHLAPFEQDDKLLETYLYKDPPLHIRRTLDQYFYSWLENTSKRDRDQVVSRHYNGEIKLTILNLTPGYKFAKERIKEIQRGDAPGRNIGHGRLATDPAVTSPSPAQLRSLKLLEDCVARFEGISYQDPQSPLLIVDQLWIWIFGSK
jgi:hypothetical protein